MPADPEQRFQCVQCEERRCNGGCTNGDAQEYGDNVHQRILYGIGQTLCHAAFTPQVAQHQAADQRSGGRQQQDNDQRNDDREMIFSVLETWRVISILTSRSFLVVSSFIRGGWIIGISAI